MSDMGDLWRKWMRPDIAGILTPISCICLKKKKKEVVWSSVKLTLQKFHVVFQADWCLVRHQGGARIRLFKHSQLIRFCKHHLNVWFSVFVSKTSFKKRIFTYIQLIFSVLNVTEFQRRLKLTVYVSDICTCHTLLLVSLFLCFPPNPDLCLSALRLLKEIL